MKRIEKVKNYVKKHKKAFIAGGVLVTTGVVSFVVLKKKLPVKGSANAILHIIRTDDGSVLSEATRAIDEKIFTDLAPEIEEMVLSEFAEDAWIERTFELGNNVTKKVEVTIKKI